VDEPAEIARELRLTIGRIARRLRRAFVDAEQGLSFLELAVLHRLDRDGPSSPGLLAGAEGVTSAAVAMALTSLDSKGMLTRRRSPDDGRRVVVAISPAGLRTLHHRESASLEQIEAVLTEHLSAAERSRLASLIPLLTKVADKL
jgi:DNA-binding MarR family transcriptional regulator